MGVISELKDSILTDIFLEPDFNPSRIIAKTSKVESRKLDGPLVAVPADSRAVVAKKIRVITTVKVEEPIYEPLAAILNRACLDLSTHDEEVLVFIENSRSRLPTIPGAETEKPVLVGFPVPRETAQRIVSGELTRIDPDWPDVPPIQGIATVVECEVSEEGDFQCLQYISVLSRHKPESSMQYGIVVNKKTFRLLCLSLDRQLRWEEVEWADQKGIEKLYTVVKLILDETTKTKSLAVPRVRKVFSLKNCTVPIYSAHLKDQEFRLLQLSSGRGNGRKPFVAIAVDKNDPADARIFKYGWYKENQRNGEQKILEKLIGIPGVVQIDKELSSQSLEADQESGRKLNLSVLKTVGYPLCSCGSVLEFLEAMYDLLEVLRYLVQEKKILHRDVSWGNVLIIPPGKSVSVARSVAETKKAGGACVENRSSSQVETAKDARIPHTYRFTHELLGEDQARVRVALVDFDHAADLEDSMDDLREATGTPMFMARDVMRPRGIVFQTVLHPLVAQEIHDTVATDYSRYSDPKEKDAWDEFLAKDRLERPRWRKGETNEEVVSSFRHGAMHDAESVFWIILLFFYRMTPLGKSLSEEQWESLKTNRGVAFKHMRTKNPGDISSFGFFDTGQLEHLHTESDDENLREIYESLDIINLYLRIPWYAVTETGRGERFEFHLHELTQRLLWKSIVKLRSNDDPILVDPRPLLVKVDTEIVGNVATSCRRSLPDFDISSAERPAKRRKIEESEIIYDEISTDSRPLGTTPVDNTSDLVQLLRPYFSADHWEILWWKRRERSWYGADYLYA